MSNDFDFIKIQPSSGAIRDKEGIIIALVWIFRPDVVTEDQHWFEYEHDDDHFHLCIETGSDKIPVNCKKVYSNLDGPSEYEPLSDEKVLNCFKFCCDLLSRKRKDNEIQRLGDEILKDSLLGDTE